jgi:hypothetical protein
MLSSLSETPEASQSACMIVQFFSSCDWGLTRKAIKNKKPFYSESTTEEIVLILCEKNQKPAVVLV